MGALACWCAARWDRVFARHLLRGVRRESRNPGTECSRRHTATCAVVKFGLLSAVYCLLSTVCCLQFAVRGRTRCLLHPVEPVEYNTI
jgi:hypothetical protein